MGSWDSWRPTRFFAPRPMPSVLYFVRKYYGDAPAKYYLIQNLPTAFLFYQWKKHKVLKIIFFCAAPLIFPMILITGFRSWHISTKKINEGSKIELL
jgi:hypothetical protein